jgi:hypothetical protein
MFAPSIRRSPARAAPPCRSNASLGPNGPLHFPASAHRDRQVPDGWDLSRVPVSLVRHAPTSPLQRKLAVGRSDDRLEREADLIADQVMGTAPSKVSAAPAPTGLDRKCASCEEEEESARVQRAPTSRGAADGEAPALVNQVLRTSGGPLEASARSFFEDRFQRDFSRVRVHADSVAAESARAVKARAYTVGRDIAFGRGEYQPATREGRRLIAHELAHVVQQSAWSPDGPTLRRADIDAVDQVVKMQEVVGSGIQFVPAASIMDTRIGPVTVQGGLASHGTSRLNVIVGANLTPRLLARQILPLWTTATPFMPPGGGPSVLPGALSEEQLAQGLLVYNQYYLPVPAMTQWRAGLHFPLPVEIEEATGIATVNPDLIRSLAAVFDPAWMPALSVPAAATAAPAAADLKAAVAEFLAAAPDALGRGMGLAARAITNAQATLPFAKEVFAQLGAGELDVGLSMFEDLTNGDMDLLAGQKDGAAILKLLREIFKAAPADISATDRARLDRANAMLARVRLAPVRNAPEAAGALPEKAVTVDLVKLDGSHHNPATDLTVANMIFAQCNVRFEKGADVTVGPAQTTAWIGTDKVLTYPRNCGVVPAEERGMFQGATAAFGLSGRIKAFFVDSISSGDRGYSRPPYCATGSAHALLNMAAIGNSGDTTTLAHEIGHILLNLGGHPKGTLMQPLPRPNEITNPQCATIHRNA